MSSNFPADFRLEWDAFWSRYHAGFSKEQLHNSRFAKLHEIKHLVKSGGGGEMSHILGLDSFYGRPLRVKATASKKELGNVLDIGTSRSGKSRREIAQLLEWPGSAIVNDIKGELYKATGGYRKSIGKVFVFDPTGRGNQFDPLEGRMSEQKLYTCAFDLLNNPDEHNKYWTERSAKMLIQIFLASRLERMRPLPYLGQLCEFGVTDVAAIISRVSLTLARKFLEAEYAPNKDYEDAPGGKTRVDAWSTLSSRLYPILTTDVVRSFDGSDFTARDILFSEEPITVYFCWPESELHALTPLIRLVWETLINDLIASYDAVGGIGCHDILLSLDEAGRTGLHRLPEYTATVNGRGIAISMSGQSFEQFKSLYGEFRAKTLLNNMDTQIYHRQASFDTAKSLEGWLGYKSGWAASQSKHENSESEGKSEREIPLLTARQIAELPDEEIIILHRNIPPIRARRMELEAYPSLTQKLHVEPPAVPLIAPVQRLPLPLLSHMLLEPGLYRLPYQAMGYAIPLHASDDPYR